ncbi:MAG: family 16 glycoside hydrolase, partial [Phycisphaerales bacterium]
LVTGLNNHNWPFTSRVFAETLEATGRFSVEITEQPELSFASADALRRVQLFVFDYNDLDQPQAWDRMAKKNFVQAVKAGAGVVAIHAANNAFKGPPAWSEYEFMVGYMWRDGAGHGKFHEFDVETVDPEHPVTRGLPPIKAHPDELYHKMSNPQLTKPHLLMQAMSSKESGGTGRAEPVAWTLGFGKGRTFVTTLGHVWKGDQASKRSVLDPQFRVLLARGAEWAATGEVTIPTTFNDVRRHNTLSDEERAAGWELLFDGTSPVGLRAFKGEAFPTKGWSVQDGELVHAAQGGGGDIVTRGEYADFEFTCDWKVAKGGNSGIMYRCDEKHNYPWETGREMQILDDEHHNDGKKPKTRAGAMYDLFECGEDVARPWGEWNTARVVCRGPRIEHWLNGVRVVDVDVESDEYREAYGASKFPSMKDFGTTASGHIALQDHGDEVRFRNIKVRRLK